MLAKDTTYAVSSGPELAKQSPKGNQLANEFEDRAVQWKSVKELPDAAKLCKVWAGEGEVTGRGLSRAPKWPEHGQRQTWSPCTSEIRGHESSRG